MIDLTTDQKSFVNAAYKHYNKDILTRGEINSFFKKEGFKNPSWLKNDKYKVFKCHDFKEEVINLLK